MGVSTIVRNLYILETVPQNHKSDSIRHVEELGPLESIRCMSQTTGHRKTSRKIPTIDSNTSIILMRLIGLPRQSF